VEGVAKAGIEPLADPFTREALRQMVKERRRELKKLLTDRMMIAGIGTAYADEICFEAKLSPIRYVNTLSDEEIDRLHAAIQAVLRQAIDIVRARTGDHLLTDEVRDFLKVYKKEGERCIVCGAKIAEIRYANTRTYYCPTCQTSGKALHDRRSWLLR
jgi:formamidopyrimidine-DNA glycosylase